MYVRESSKTCGKRDTVVGWRWVPPVLLVVTFIWAFVCLGTVPPIWFDEGWALSLARNWAEIGHYGHLLLGKPVPATILNTGVPAVAPLTLSFRLLGVGLWQARMPGVLYTLGALSALYYIALELYGERVAVATILAALLLSVHPDLHPILVGRQALGEMPAAFFLTMGFASSLGLRRKAECRAVIPPLFWALALRTKPQVFPFLIVSFVLPLGILLLEHRRSLAKQLLVHLCLTLVFDRAMSWLWAGYVRTHVLAAEPSADPYAVLLDFRNILTYVIVLNPRVHFNTFLGLVLLVGLPGLIGLLYVGRVLLKRAQSHGYGTGADVVELMVWVCSASWYLWHLLLSIGWTRYLFPAAFVANVFFAAFVSDLSRGFDMQRTLLTGAQLLRGTDGKHEALRITLALVLVAVAAFSTVRTLVQAYGNRDDSLSAVARFLNSQTDTDALIETYESELFFLVDRSFHYPPDDVQHLLNRRTFLGEDLQIGYDPSLWDPDYVVLGPFTRMWGLYDSWLAGDDFGLVFQTSRYQVFKRSRQDECSHIGMFRR